MNWHETFLITGQSLHFLYAFPVIYYSSISFIMWKKIVETALFVTWGLNVYYFNK